VIPFGLHRRVPLLRRPFYQRDLAISQRDEALRTVASMAAQLDEALRDAAIAAAKRNEACAEREGLPREITPKTAKSRAIGSLREFDEIFAECAAMETEVERIDLLSNCHLCDSDIIQMPDDPFSPEYEAAVLRVYSKLSGRSTYSAAECEKVPIDIENTIKKPSAYQYGGNFLGDYLEAYGQIIKCLKISDGMRLLEYGPGDGQISLHLARLGCDVTVIDIEDAYLQIIRGQAERAGIAIAAIHGDFLAGEELEPFDRILFFEAFHHSLVHQRALQKMGCMIKRDGFILFVGEPIIDPAGYWAAAVPYPWGPRLDGLSLRAMRTHGWMELGFQEPYFLAALDRCGWAGEKWVSPTNGLATGFIARRRSHDNAT